MISIERAKLLIGDPTLSDEDAENLRDSVRSLAEIIFEHWQKEKQDISMKINRKDEDNGVIG